MGQYAKMKLVKAKRYFSQDPRGFFIVFFQALILACAFLLIEGGPAVDSGAVFAYCSLIVGVVLQAASSVGEKASGECA